jgi:hypothetical protein
MQNLEANNFMYNGRLFLKKKSITVDYLGSSLLSSFLRGSESATSANAP